MYCLFCVVLCIVFVYMCTEQLPPAGYPIAVKYIISSKKLNHVLLGDLARWRFTLQSSYTSRGGQL